MKVFLSLGDLSAANYIYAVFREGFEDMELVGITDPRLESAGVKSVASVGDISAVGLVEALSRIPKAMSLLRRIERVLGDCDALIACDAPAFNLRLIKRARKRGVRRVIYFISPQVWAWKPERAETIRRFCDHLIVVLPFEVEIYRPLEGKDFKVHYVGHPLVDLVSPGLSLGEFRLRTGIEGDFLNLMPGSRWTEIRKHLPLLRETLDLLNLPSAVPTFPEFEDTVKEALPGSRVLTEEEIPGPAYTCMFYSRCSLIASGTASLEASLAGSPHIVFYRVNPLTLWVGRRLVRVPFISLPNLLTGREVVPEILNPSPEDLARRTLDLWEREDLRRSQREAFQEIREKLGSGGVIDRLRNLFRDLLSF
jgi:lipid-A-disaccharide synthase